MKRPYSPPATALSTHGLAHGDLQRVLAGRGQIYGYVTAAHRGLAPSPFIREAGQVSGGGWYLSVYPHMQAVVRCVWGHARTHTV